MNKISTYIIGVIVGIIGGFAKWGWEIPFPPRNPNVGFPLEGMTGAVVQDGVLQRVTPPQVFLEMLNLPHDWTYHFSGIELPLSIFIVHMLFSVFFGVLYCVLAEKFPIISLFYGAIFAIFVNFFSHCLVMPLLGLVPSVLEQPFDEHFSEIFGHIFWLFVMDLCRRSLIFEFQKKKI